MKHRRKAATTAGHGPRHGGSNATYNEVVAKSVTRIPGAVDPWFLARYGMNLYRGCEHGCLYCDGRAERYYVQGDFARDIVVKINAPAVLDRELARAREPGFLFLGGGVCDAYQPAEKRYGLTRSVLELALKHRLPVHILTKSDLVQRDLDLLVSINEQSRAILSFSIQTTDEEVRRRFEPGAAPLERRWELLEMAHSRNLCTGVMAMPVLPGISDQPESILRLVARARACGAAFVCSGGLTLRPGAQSSTYMDSVSRHYPDLADGYDKLYRCAGASGAGLPRYYARVDQRFHQALESCGLPGRIPRRVFQGQMPLYAEVAVLLEHEEFCRRRRSEPAAGLDKAGWAIQKWARGRFAANRSKSYTFHQVEQEFLEQVEGQALGAPLGLTRSSLAAIGSILESRPKPGDKGAVAGQQLLWPWLADR